MATKQGIKAVDGGEPNHANESMALSASVPKGILYMVIAALVGAGGGSLLTNGVARGDTTTTNITPTPVAMSIDTEAVAKRAEERAVARAVAATAPLVAQLANLDQRLLAVEKSLVIVDGRVYELLGLVRGSMQTTPASRRTR